MLAPTLHPRDSWQLTIQTLNPADEGRGCLQYCFPERSANTASSMTGQEGPGCSPGEVTAGGRGSLGHA